LPGGRAWPAIAVATAPSGGTFNEAMYVPTGGLTIAGGSLTSLKNPVYVHTPSGGRPEAPGTRR
jgi:hypothetical protein